MLLLSELEKDFKIIKEKGKDEVHFTVNVNEKGVNAEVKVIGYCLQDKYVQVIGFEVTAATAKIGAKRKEMIVEYLKELLLQKKYLLIREEVEDGYALGKHYFEEGTISDSYLAKFVEKVKIKDLELLLTQEKEERMYGNVEAYYLEFFYYKNNIYLNKVKKNEENDKTIEEKLTSYYTDAIDENGITYEKFPVKDPDNIRFFKVNNKNDIKVKDIFHDDWSGYVLGYTFKEIETQYFPSEKLGSLALPLSFENFTIHSKRLIGEEPKIYKKGEWVIVNERPYPYHRNMSVEKGKYGEVIGQYGCYVQVKLEDQYEDESENIRYTYLEKAENPFQDVDKKFVLFKRSFHNDGHYLRGFGFVVTETERTVKVLTVGSASKFKESGTGSRDKDYQEYVLLKKEEVEHLSPETAKELGDFVQKITEKEDEYVILSNVLKAAKDLEERNVKYYAALLTYIIQAKKQSFVYVLKVLTSKIASNLEPSWRDNSSYKKFDDCDANQWIQSLLD